MINAPPNTSIHIYIYTYVHIGTMFVVFNVGPVGFQIMRARGFLQMRKYSVAKCNAIQPSALQLLPASHLGGPLLPAEGLDHGLKTKQHVCKNIGLPPSVSYLYLL